MESPFILRPNLPINDIAEAVCERVTKAQGIITVIMADCEDGELTINIPSLNHALWAIDGLLDEVKSLSESECFI